MCGGGGGGGGGGIAVVCKEVVPILRWLASHTFQLLGCITTLLRCTHSAECLHFSIIFKTESHFCQ